jgi:hypothetical protein
VSPGRDKLVKEAHGVLVGLERCYKRVSWILTREVKWRRDVSVGIG